MPLSFSPSLCPTLSLSHLRKLSGLALSLLTLFLSVLGLSSVCVLVCLCVVLVFAGGLSNPGSPPTWPFVYPAAHSLLGTAFKSTGNAMKGLRPLFRSVSFSLFICIQPLCWLTAYCFCWPLRLVPEEPNKSVIYRRAVCAPVGAKQSTALDFMAGLSTLEYTLFLCDHLMSLFSSRAS